MTLTSQDYYPSLINLITSSLIITSRNIKETIFEILDSDTKAPSLSYYYMPSSPLIKLIGFFVKFF